MGLTTPWDRDPVTGRSYLIEDGPYPLRDPAVTNRDAAYQLSRAMVSRYGAGSPEQVAGRFNADIENPLKPTLKPSTTVLKGTLTSAGAYGRYSPEKNVIEYETGPGSSPSMQLATLAHEYSHAADEAQSFGSFEPTRQAYEMKSKGMHHQGLEDAEMELTGLMTAQDQLQRGQTINPDFYKYYPRLSEVKPLSSQPLAGPWDFRRR